MKTVTVEFVGKVYINTNTRLVIHPTDSKTWTLFCEVYDNDTGAWNQETLDDLVLDSKHLMALAFVVDQLTGGVSTQVPEFQGSN